MKTALYGEIFHLASWAPAGRIGGQERVWTERNVGEIYMRGAVHMAMEGTTNSAPRRPVSTRLVAFIIMIKN